MRFLLALCAVGLAACGGGDSKPPATETKLEADTRVIRAWSDDLRRGDEAAAAARFALPAVVSNGTKPVRVTTRELVRAFHDTLSCGGVLVAAAEHHGLTIARFRLTDRPGGACRDAVGDHAAAAFEITNGRIVRWLRVDDPGSRTPSGPMV